MRRLTSTLGSIALVLSLVPMLGTGAPRPASALSPGRFVSGWIPNWSAAVVSDGLRAIGNGHAAVLADISPFAYVAKDATTIALNGSSASLATAVATLRASKLPIIPTVTDGTGKLEMAGILADDTSRAQHVAALTNLVVAQGYDGIDLDYEGFAFTDGSTSWATTRPNWAKFVIELGASLHANGKLLSVTVPPIWNHGGYWMYSWQDRDPALDILPAVDRLRLMVYDWSVSSAGPISPMSWVTDVLSYVKNRVPGDQLRKVQMGVPAYGRSWAKVLSGSCPADAPLGTVAVQMENVPALLVKPGAQVVRDVSGELKLTYDEIFTGSGSAVPPPPFVPASPDRATEVAPAGTDGLGFAVRLDGATCAVHRTVYFPDETALVARADAAVKAGLSGIVVWAMGYETDALWSSLAGIDVARPPGSAPIGSLDVAQALGGTGVRVAGWVMDPELDLPITFTVSVDGGASSGPIMARLARPDVAQLIPSADPLHGFDVVVPIATSPGANVCITAVGYAAGASPVTFCRTATA